MNAHEQELDHLVRTLAAEWSGLSDPGTGERLLSDPILVLGPDGINPVPRDAFLSAVTARASAVSDVPATRTTLADVTAHALGDRMVVATISWVFSHGTTSTRLVSDFLLHREPSGALRCVAYLPRTNVLDHLPSERTR